MTDVVGYDLAAFETATDVAGLMASGVPQSLRREAEAVLTEYMDEFPDDDRAVIWGYWDRRIQDLTDSVASDPVDSILVRAYLDFVFTCQVAVVLFDSRTDFREKVEAALAGEVVGLTGDRARSFIVSAYREAAEADRRHAERQAL